METLIAKTNLCKTEWYLCDSRNAFLGAFSTLQALADFCRANGYRYRVV